MARRKKKAVDRFEAAKRHKERLLRNEQKCSELSEILNKAVDFKDVVHFIEFRRKDVVYKKKIVNRAFLNSKWSEKYSNHLEEKRLKEVENVNNQIKQIAAKLNELYQDDKIAALCVAANYEGRKLRDYKCLTNGLPFSLPSCRLIEDHEKINFIDLLNRDFSVELSGYLYRIDAIEYDDYDDEYYEIDFDIALDRLLHPEKYMPGFKSWDEFEYDPADEVYAEAVKSALRSPTECHPSFFDRCVKALKLNHENNGGIWRIYQQEGALDYGHIRRVINAYTRHNETGYDYYLKNGLSREDALDLAIEEIKNKV